VPLTRLPDDIKGREVRDWLRPSTMNYALGSYCSHRDLIGIARRAFRSGVCFAGPNRYLNARRSARPVDLYL
jgi:hypothetical protein